MIRSFVCCVVLALSLTPAATRAEQIKLKVSYFSSDRSITYLAAVKPFIDAVEAATEGAVTFDVSFSGALGPLNQQPQLVLDGKADIAMVVPGYTPALFPDNAVMEMPGLFHNLREATMVYTRLIAAGMLEGYDKFFVIGAYCTDPETVHSRVPITQLADLRGKKVRVNNNGEAAAMKALGAVPVAMPVIEVSNGLSGGRIDATLVPLSPLSEFGIKRIATHHYLLPVSVAPLLLVMNRERFEALPKPIQEIFRRHAGEWTAEHFIDIRSQEEREIVAELTSDSKRKVVLPTASDRQKARAAFKTVMQDWLAAHPSKGDLLTTVSQKITRMRCSDPARAGGPGCKPSEPSAKVQP